MKLQLVNLSKLDMSAFGEVRKYGDPEQMRALLTGAPAAALETFIQGLDLSDWNGKADAKKAKAKGVVFVIRKSSQGLGHKQTGHVQCYEEFRAEGIEVGFYHFFESAKDGVGQVDNHLESIEGLNPTLISTIDVEYVTAEPHLATSNLQHVHLEYERIKGRLPMDYASVGMWDGYILNWSRWKESPLFAAHWNVSEPLLPSPWNGIGWKVWQYTVAVGQGALWGVASKSVDLDYSKQHYLEAITWSGTQPEPEPEPEPEPPPPDGLPVFPTLPKAKVIATAPLMVRTGPGRYYNLIGKLINGDTPEIIRGALDEWGNIWLQHGYNQWSAMIYQDQPLMKWM
jgi:lysozyme